MAAFIDWKVDHVLLSDSDPPIYKYKPVYIHSRDNIIALALFSVDDIICNLLFPFPVSILGHVIVSWQLVNNCTWASFGWQKNINKLN